MHCFSPLTPTVLLERTGRVFPRAIALQTSDRVVTYGQLLQRSRRLASALLHHGVRYGERVAILAENCQEVVEAYFGVPAAGAVLVSLNPWLPPAELEAQLQFVGCKVLLVSRRYLSSEGAEVLARPDRLLLVLGADDVPTQTPNVISYEQALRMYGSNERPLDGALRSEMDPISITFTSGTTGQPKGVMLSHRGAYLHALGQVMMMRLTRDSRYLWTLAMFHVNGWGHIWANVAVGATQLLASLPEPDELSEARYAQQMRNFRTTHLAGSPRLLKRLVGIDPLRSSWRGRVVVTGGAAPSPQLLVQLEALEVVLVHQYGLNETCGPYVVCEEQLDWARETSTRRAALQARQGVAAMHVGTGLRVVSDDGRDVPADGKTSGEVLMAGNTVAIGYFGNPEATGRAFVDGWFHSGDIAVVHPDGYLEIKDRIKDLIYVETAYGWENISSIEVENVISMVEGVDDVAVVGVRPAHADRGAELFAFVETSSDREPLLRRVEEWCAHRLPAHMRPLHIVFDTIPKTATGKVRKHELAARASTLRETKAAARKAAPRLHAHALESE